MSRIKDVPREEKTLTTTKPFCQSLGQVKMLAATALRLVTGQCQCPQSVDYQWSDNPHGRRAVAALPAAGSMRGSDIVTALGGLTKLSPIVSTFRQGNPYRGMLDCFRREFGGSILR